jgi:hypothetical protein
MVMIGGAGASRALVRGAFYDFSRARTEEHYEHLHPKMSGKFKARMAAADVMSAAAVQLFVNLNKLEAHFRRATAGIFKITIRSAEGKLISPLYDLTTKIRRW